MISETLLQKRDIDKAIAWLENIEVQNLEHPTRYEWVKLPWMKNGYSEYRIMDDGETDDRKYWVEFKPPFSVTPSDLLLIKKPK